MTFLIAFLALATLLTGVVLLAERWAIVRANRELTRVYRTRTERSP
jgi:hypothetical protein